MGSVVIAVIAGSAAFTIAVIGGVPLAALIGLWAAITNFIPQVGGYLGAAPLVILGFTTGTTKRSRDHGRPTSSTCRSRTA